MDPAVLAQVLQPLQHLSQNNHIPRLLVGLNVADDATIYQLNDEQAIINTLDFFTPVVDDPYEYGAIAAANAMSDVFAMGGEVLFALNVAGFPGAMDPAVISEVFRGGAEKVIEAGAIIAGGHTVQDDEPKYGLAVTGLVHPQKFFTKGGAQPGDVLALTKPLGTGAISTALKQDKAQPAHVTEMVAWMKTLNRNAAKVAHETGGIKAVTDVTGFGLLGHGAEMARAGGAQFQLEWRKIPLMTGALDYIQAHILPGGTFNNKLFYEKGVSFSANLTEAQQLVLWDAQTSGGLLMAIPADKVGRFEAACKKYNQPAWIIGRVAAGTGIVVKD